MHLLSNRSHSGKSCLSRIPGGYLVSASLFLLPLLNGESLRAQDNQNNSSPREIPMAAEKLKPLEGYYQNSNNKDLYVQFTAMENALLAKLLWNNNSIRLYPSSENHFFAKGDEPLTIRFERVGTDSTVFFLRDEKEPWRKVREYKPLVKKEMAHTPDQLKAFEGFYQLDREDAVLELFERDNTLVLKQHWDNRELAFLPESPNDFYGRDQMQFTLKFLHDSAGKVTEMIAFNRDHWHRMQPVVNSRDQLKIFAGKYRFKDDPDDVIEIEAAVGALVVTQLWDKKKTTVPQRTDTYFYDAGQSYSLKFAKDSGGAVTRVTVLNQDVFEKVKD